MQLHNAVLALQIMNGVKVYDVRYQGSDRNSPTYSYKSDLDLEVDDWVIAPVGEGDKFLFAQIVREVHEIDYDAEYPLRWITQKINDPFARYKEQKSIDEKARQKLAMSQVKKVAEEYLADLKLTTSDFSIEELTRTEDAE